MCWAFAISLAYVTSNPHDTFFKEMFSDPEVIRSYLQEYLPKESLEGLDLSTIKVCPTNYLSSKFSVHISDLLFEVRSKHKRALVLLLFEHKSYEDWMMTLILLGYMVDIWRDFLKQNPGARYLPEIYPLVIYHGQKPWGAPSRLRDLIDKPRLVPESLTPDFAFQLHDLTASADSQLRGAALLRLALRMMKFGRDLGVWEKSAEWLNAASKGQTGRKAMRILRSVLYYLMFVHGPEAKVGLETMMQQLEPALEKKMKTLADALRDEGLEQGLEQGLERGRMQGQIATVLRQLVLRFGPLSKAIEARVENGNAAQLDLWSERILTAQTLDQLFDA